MSVLLVIGALLMGNAFYVDNKDFFETANKQKKDGYSWNWVGPTPLDPKAKNLPLQVKDEEPFILWKLKK